MSHFFLSFLFYSQIVEYDGFTMVQYCTDLLWAISCPLFFPSIVQYWLRERTKIIIKISLLLHFDAEIYREDEKSAHSNWELLRAVGLLYVQKASVGNSISWRIVKSGLNALLQLNLCFNKLLVRICCYCLSWALLPSVRPLAGKAACAYLHALTHNLAEQSCWTTVGIYSACTVHVLQLLLIINNSETCTTKTMQCRL